MLAIGVSIVPRTKTISIPEDLLERPQDCSNFVSEPDNFEISRLGGCLQSYEGRFVTR